MLIKSLSVQVSGFLPHGNHAETPPPPPSPKSLLLSSPAPQSGTISDSQSNPPPPHPKMTGITDRVRSQLFPKNTTTNTIAPARGSVLCWKMRYKIYLRFLVFVKIESSHFNCSQLGAPLQATGNGGPACRPPPLVLCGLLCSIVQNGDYDLALSSPSILFRII